MGKNNKRRRRKNKGHPYNDTFNSTSSEFYKMNNKILGINFENNIRETLKFEYQWKNLNLNESFLYSDIKIEDKTEVITDVNENKITINDKEIIFKINKDKTVNIIMEGKIEKLENNELPKVKEIYNNQITINKIKDCQIDGLFENYDFTKFDKEEIGIISANIDTSKIDNKLFPKAVLEIKLSRNKVEDLFSQMKRDQQIIKYKMKENAIYLGFINSNSVDTKIMKNIKKQLKDINYVLFGVKNNKFAKREITQFYDWLLIYKVQSLEQSIKNIKQRVEVIENDVKNINNKLDHLISLFSRRNNLILGRKRKREKKRRSEEGKGKGKKEKE